MTRYDDKVNIGSRTVLYRMCCVHTECLSISSLMAERELCFPEGALHSSFDLHDQHTLKLPSCFPTGRIG